MLDQLADWGLLLLVVFFGFFIVAVCCAAICPKPKIGGTHFKGKVY
jgi:hypothetical protein